MNICKAPEFLANAASVSAGWPCLTTVLHATPAASPAAVTLLVLHDPVLLHGAFAAPLTHLVYES
jgi:hypothetical protein